MTTEPRYFALVAKVGKAPQAVEDVCGLSDQEEYLLLNSVIRALKGEIMRHEPREGIWGSPVCSTCEEGRDPEPASWPCKPWLDIEGEVGK